MITPQIDKLASFLLVKKDGGVVLILPVIRRAQDF
jgi:hypothetical protein